MRAKGLVFHPYAFKLCTMVHCAAKNKTKILWLSLHRFLLLFTLKLKMNDTQFVHRCMYSLLWIVWLKGYNHGCNFFLFMNLMFEYRYTEQMHYHSLWFILNFLHEHKYWKLQVYIITVRNYKLFSFFFSIKSELCQVKRICFCFIFVCKALFIFIVDHYVLD